MAEILNLRRGEYLQIRGMIRKELCSLTLIKRKVCDGSLIPNGTKALDRCLAELLEMSVRFQHQVDAAEAEHGAVDAAFKKDLDLLRTILTDCAEVIELLTWFRAEFSRRT